VDTAAKTDNTESQPNFTSLQVSSEGYNDPVSTEMVGKPEIVRILQFDEWKHKSQLDFSPDILAFEKAYHPTLTYIKEVKNSDRLGLQYFFWNSNQNSNNDSVPVHISSSPIGKNLVSLSYQVAWSMSHSISLVSGVECDSDICPERLDPWVWSRISRCQLRDIAPNNDDVEKSWGCYFQMPNVRTPPERDASLGLADMIEEHMVDQSLTKLRRFLSVKHLQPKKKKKRPARKWGFSLLHGITKYPFKVVQAMTYSWAQSVRYLLSVNKPTNDEVAEMKQNIDWPDSSEQTGTIASIHLRRGDVGTFRCAHKQSYRSCTLLEKQLARLRSMSEQYNVTHVYLMTEEPKEVELARQLAPEYKWMSLCEHVNAKIKMPRNTSDQDSMDLGMEDWSLAISYESKFDGKMIQKHVISLLAEIQLFAEADIHIIEPFSCTSMLSWLYSYGQKGYIPPHTPSIFMAQKSSISNNKSEDNSTTTKSIPSKWYTLLQMCYDG